MRERCAAIRVGASQQRSAEADMQAAILTLALTWGSVGDGIPMPKHGTNHTFERAGRALDVHRFAVPNGGCKYVTYYVGGGCWKGRRRCDCRTPSEGTFGFDFRGHPCAPRRVALKWFHGRRRQGADGSYEPNGPHVPDVPNAIRYVKEDPTVEE